MTVVTQYPDEDTDDLGQSSVGVNFDHDGTSTTVTIVKLNWIKPTCDTTTWKLTGLSM